MKQKIIIILSVSLFSVFCYSLNAIIHIPGAGSIEWRQAAAAAAFPGRSGHKTAVFKNSLWITGGWDGEKFLDDIWSSRDGVNWICVKKNAPFRGRIGHSLAVFKNALWLIGGITMNRSGDLIDFNDVWRSDDGKNWRPVTLHAPFSKRGGHSCAVFRGRMYLTGGIDKSGAEVWHTCDGTHWVRDTAHAGFGIRGSHSSVVYNGRLWVIGGMHVDSSNRFTPLPDVWSSADGILWETAADNPRSFGGAGTSAAVFDGRIWVIGGFKKSGTVYYSTDGSDWKQANLSADFGERVCHETVVFMDRLWITGGYDGRAHRGDLWYALLPEKFSENGGY